MAARPSGENGSAAASRRQGVAGDLDGAIGEVPGKEEEAGAHWSGGLTVRWRKWRRAAVFNGGGVASVVVDEGGWVLQHEGDQGVRRQRSIEEWSNSEALTGRGRTAVTLGRSPAWMRAPVAGSRRGGHLGGGG
jgi:hypothetical protein